MIRKKELLRYIEALEDEQFAMMDNISTTDNIVHKLVSDMMYVLANAEFKKVKATKKVKKSKKARK